MMAGVEGGGSAASSLGGGLGKVAQEWDGRLCGG